MKPNLFILGALYALALPMQGALIAQYGFETGGQNDANPGTLNGTLLGNAAVGAVLSSGLGAGSLVLDGAGDGLQLASGSNVINGAGVVTVSTFFSVNVRPGAGGVQNFVWIGRNGNDGEVRFGLQLFDTNKIRVIGRAIDGGGSGSAVFNANISTNTLYHIAATLNYGTGSVDLYLNGVFFGSQTGIANLTAAGGSLPNTNSNRAAIGSNGAVNGEYFNGSLDDVRIYNEALDASTIAAIAAAGLVPEPSVMLISIPAAVLLLGARRRTC